MQILRSALAVSQLESRLFRSFPKLRVSVLGIILIPALYAFIYLNSVWDPATQTGNLPAAIVNLDQGAQVGETPANLGAEVVRALKATLLLVRNLSSTADATRLLHSAKLWSPQGLSFQTRTSSTHGRPVTSMTTTLNVTSTSLSVKRFALRRKRGSRRLRCLLSGPVSSSSRLS